MNYLDLMYLHLATVLPCFIIGTVLLVIKKGTTIHVNFGRIYMILMLFTAIVTLFMPAHVGPKIFNHFGWIHSFSFLTIYSVPTAYWAIKKGNVKAHKRKMILLYFGAIIIAGAFTFSPGRYLHDLFF
ncbi:DUF2306 domain-containing protein [Yeosuana marina]|uniref:DUF2306 domain-containing protein n=1 Tax=Yeosuana marina TaxID=1565536 RepID=UPI0030ED8ACD|tara:strand:- start:1334 stop:1717 length:384 start_codon:yes stop_codon:yes gene_type:complete